MASSEKGELTKKHSKFNMKTCDRQIVNKEMKPNKNIIKKISTAAFHFITKKLLPYFLHNKFQLK